MKISKKLNIILLVGMVLLLFVIGNPDYAFSGEELECPGPVDRVHACDIGGPGSPAKCINWTGGAVLTCNQQ